MKIHLSLVLPNDDYYLRVENAFLPVEFLIANLFLAEYFSPGSVERLNFLWAQPFLFFKYLIVKLWKILNSKLIMICKFHDFNFMIKGLSIRYVISCFKYRYKKRLQFDTSPLIHLPHLMNFKGVGWARENLG